MNLGSAIDSLTLLQGRICIWMMVVKVTLDFPAMAAAWGDTNTLRKILSSYYDVMFVSL
jgi:hypothetical protein